MAIKTQDAPAKLKPFVFHGVDVEPREGQVEALGTCPFCDKRKLYVNCDTGQWSCKVCGSHGNIPTFLKQLYKESDKITDTDAVSELMEHRGYLLPETVIEWGPVKSCITSEWLLPTYGQNKNLSQLNRYVTERSGGYRVYMTPETQAQLYGLQLWNPNASYVYVTEGLWDAMALWEVLRSAKFADDETGGLMYTSAPNASLLSASNVVAAPSCSIFSQTWAQLFHGKHVIFLYDNDHPRKHPQTGNKIGLEGWQGMRRACQLLGASDCEPASVSCIYWGEGTSGNAGAAEGYDPKLPDGCDVRDWLRGAGEVTEEEDSMSRRVHRLQQLLGKVRLAPEGWGGPAKAHSVFVSRLDPADCNKYSDLLNSCRKAMKWTKGLDHAFVAMLASIASTPAGGNQLWLKVIGPAGCGKSTVCEALSANKVHVVSKSTMRGFHSGFKTGRGQQGEEDNSLIALCANKTLITKDGDTLLQSPNYRQILSEARDLYDRVSRTHYRHGLQRDYENVPITWLLCGTSSLRALDQSELGERFLDVVIMEAIDIEMEREVTRRAQRQELAAAGTRFNGKAESQHMPNTIEMMKMAAGYIDYLRLNAVEQVEALEWDDEVLDKIHSYATFVSYMRARPSTRQEETAERELSTRLVSQLTRLAAYMTVVLNKPKADAEVIGRVRQVALDTARGQTFDMAKYIANEGVKGIEVRSLCYLTNQTTENKTRELLRFLKRIGAAETFRQQLTAGLSGQPRWRLTDHMMNLYTEMMEDVV